MASQPSYDPNDFAVRISKDEWQQLNEDPEHPLARSRHSGATRAGLDFQNFHDHGDARIEGDSRGLSRCSVPGYAEFYGRIFHDAEKAGARRSGLAQRHRAFLRRLLLQRRQAAGNRSHLLLRHQAGPGTQNRNRFAGRRVSAWCRRKPGRNASFIRNGIRARRFRFRSARERRWSRRCRLPTPSAASRWAAAFHQPHLLLNDQRRHRRLISPSPNRPPKRVTQAMYGVVNEGGTAGASKLPGIELCGKTGTAQVISLTRAGSAPENRPD